MYRIPNGFILMETDSNTGKPAALAGGVAAGGVAATAAHKHHEPTKEVEPVSADTPETETQARIVSSDEEDNIKKNQKSRSVSRGKRSSIFGSLLGKKEEIQEKKEIKKEEKAEEKEAKEEHKEQKAEEKAVRKHEPLAEEAAVASAPFDAQAVGA